MDNPVAVFRWVTLCAICWVLILCTGCASEPLVFEERESEVDIKVVTYPNDVALQIAHEAIHQHDTEPTGFYKTSGGVCTIHVLQMTNYNNFYDKACEWGHELAHCVYGKFHGDLEFRGC